MSAPSIFLFVSFYFTLTNGDYLTVTTKPGKVSGITKTTLLQNKEYYSFLGIPYAEPPLKDLRFMPPQPKHEWDDIWEAHKEPEACAQFYMPIRKRTTQLGYFGQEDCLYLSVHTPNVETDEPLPVIVFTVNDNFKSSYNGSNDYSPDFFIEEDVIVVTLSNRLGSIGFLSMQDDIIPGNNGLKDIILALRWVQDNIEYFGGDCKRVTLMGSVGGAAAVDLLLHSKQARGLFSAVILQSGTSWTSTYFGSDPRMDAIKLSELVERKASTTSTLLKNFRKIPAASLLENEMSVVRSEDSRFKQRGIVAFGPTVEHDHPESVLTAKPEDAAFQIDVPIMIGYNTREGIEYSSRYLERPSFLTYADRDFMFLFPIRKNYHFKAGDNAYYNAIQEVKDFYFEEGYVKISKPGEFITYIGDVMSIYPIDYTVRKYVNASTAPLFYYAFDYSGLLNGFKHDTLSTASSLDGTWGATMRDELCYLFVCNTIKKNYLNGLKDPEAFEELKILRKMVRLWSNFAKTRNPTPPSDDDDILDGFTWIPTTAMEKNILEISKTLKMKKNLFAGRIKFWDNFLRKYEEKAVDGVIKTDKKPDDDEVYEELNNKLEVEVDSLEIEDTVASIVEDRVRVVNNDEL